MMQQPLQEVLMLRMRTCHSPGNLWCSAVTLRHPKEAVGALEYDINSQPQIFEPDITAYRNLAIASGTYQGETKTIACFPSNQLELENFEKHRLVMYKIFRGDETSHGCLDQQMIIPDHVDDDIIARVAMTTGSGATGASMSEPIYAAAGFIISDYYFTGNYERAVNTTTTLNIYRYEPSGDPSDWIKIGEFSDTVGTESQVVDLSLAASGNDLSIFWLYKNQDADRREIWGYTIEDAATIDLPETIAPSIPIYYEISGNTIGDTINTDQDGQGDNSVLITWTEKFGSYNNLVCRAGEVLYTIGQPSEIYPIHDLSSDVEADAQFPVITVNNSDYRDNIAFCQYDYDYQFTDNLSHRDLSSGEWKPPVNRVVTGLEYSATSMTYRYFGTPRQIWRYGGISLRTEHDDVCNFPYYAPAFVKIATDRSNRMDIFTAYGYDNDNICLIQQLEP